MTAAAGLAMTPDLGELFEELWAYRPAVRALALRLLNDKNSADDVVQETYLRAWRGLPAAAARGPVPHAWLVTITRHVVIDMMREAMRRPMFSGEEPPDVSDPGREPDEAVIGRMDAATACAALPLLEDRQRLVVEARFLRGLSMLETAAEVGCSLGAVKQLQRRGLLKLRREVAS